jgi:predicted lipoprotein with Yx(FWY)xxD motif
MKNSTIVWIAIVALLILGLAWHLIAGGASPAPAASGATATSTTTTTQAAIPGDNLTLGQDANATVGKYLIGYNGMTLYTYAPDTAGISNCTGSCATTWPPYAVTSTDNLVAESPISGTIGTLTRAGGSIQVTYNGHPLYFYSGDTQSEDTNGQGIGGVWYVAQP